MENHGVEATVYTNSGVTIQCACGEKFFHELVEDGAFKSGFENTVEFVYAKFQEHVRKQAKISERLFIRTLKLVLAKQHGASSDVLTPILLNRDALLHEILAAVSDRQIPVDKAAHDVLQVFWDAMELIQGLPDPAFAPFLCPVCNKLVGQMKDGTKYHQNDLSLICEVGKQAES